MVLPRPRIGTRVMPQGNWNFLDQELLTWWMTEENFHQVVDHFLVMRISLEPQACLLAATLGTPEQKARLNALMEEMVALKSILSVNAGLKWIWRGTSISTNERQSLSNLFCDAISFGLSHLLYLNHL